MKLNQGKVKSNPYENIKSFYKNLLKSGYKLHEIDEMDIKFWFELMMYEEEIKEVTADEIPWL